MVTYFIQTSRTLPFFKSKTRALLTENDAKHIYSTQCKHLESFLNISGFVIDMQQIFK